MKKHKNNQKKERKQPFRRWSKNRKWLFVADMCGWTGAVILLLGYGLVSFGAIDGQSFAYQIMSLIGSAGLLVLGLGRKAIPSVVANFVWGAIALWTIGRIIMEWIL